MTEIPRYVEEKVWRKEYPEGVPHEIDIPQRGRAVRVWEGKICKVQISEKDRIDEIPKGPAGKYLKRKLKDREVFGEDLGVTAY